MIMREALSKLYSGKLAFYRQLTLFSICGIAGLFSAFVTLEQKGLAEVTVLNKLFFCVLWLLFTFFMVGYETLFMHERKIPEIDMRSLKLPFCKVLFLVFIIGVPLFLASLFFPLYRGIISIIEILLAVPLTMLMAGFSYNFNNSEGFNFLLKLNAKEYFILILKRLFVIICAYIFVFLMIALLLFVTGVTSLIIYKGDLTSAGMFISSNQIVIIKLVNFIAGILLVYALSVAALVWDYELITTFKSSDMCN